MNFKELPNKPVTRNSQPVTFYLYISPWYLKKVIKNLKLQIKNFSLVCYFYPLTKIKPKKVFEGKNKVFVY